MSFNRGVKRNSFGSLRNNFGRSGGGGGNSSMGGMGGGNGGGNTGMTGGQNNRGMNPWESGSMPGRGILPTPNNNLSINSSQAELVIVSNLLNNLIRTQQEPQPQVPSLLSLGTSLNNPLSNFRSPGNFGNNGRFNDRLQRLGNNKNQQQQQRVQPYNKMGNNRARDGVAGRRGPASAQFRAQSQSGNQRNNGNQNQHRNDKNTKASKKNETSKKEQLDVKKNNEKPITENVVKSDEAEDSQDKKRDWKDEKKDVDATVVKKIDDKKNDKGSADKNNKKNDDNSGGKKIETRHADSRYSAVPTTQMTCHVCTKRMWDGSSFENHIRGRAHQLMMEKLDESYKLKVDLMRHELRVSEEQREISLNNSKRRGKKVPVDLNVREYCTMCDLNFYGTLTNHRKSDKHQQLKTFLHPRCVPCSKEFPSRIEYDEHRLTPGHMINTVQTEEQKKTKKQKLAKGESEVCNANDEEKDTQVNEVNKTTDKDDEPLADNIEYLLDIIDDMDMKKYKVPSLKYFKQKQIKVGNSMIKEVQGYHCDKCRKFMLTLDDVSMHLKTVTHYKNFAAEVKLLTTPVEKINEAVDATTATPIETPPTTTTTTTTTTSATADESTEMKVDEKDTNTEEPSTVNDDDDDNKEENNQDNDDDYDGNFKRRKLDTTTTTTTIENNDDKIDDIDDKIDSQMDEIDDIDDDIEDLQNIIDNSDENNKIQDTNENDNLINDIINDKINDDVENNGIKESINIQNELKTNCDEGEGDISMMSVEAFGDKPKIDDKKTENNDVKAAEVVVEKIDDKNDEIIEKSVSSDNQVSQDEKIVEKTVVPEKIAEKIIVPDKVVEKKSVPEKTPIPAKIAEEIKKVIDSMPEAPPAPIISSPINQHHRHSLNNSKNHSPNMHTPNKSPRGGGGFRGNRGNRGTQRARRSRR